MKKGLACLAMLIGTALCAQSGSVSINGINWGYCSYEDGVCIVSASLGSGIMLSENYTLEIPESLGDLPVVAVASGAIGNDWNAQWNRVMRIEFPETVTALPRIVSYVYYEPYEEFTLLVDGDASPVSAMFTFTDNSQFPPRTGPLTLAFQGPLLENLMCQPWTVGGQTEDGTYVFEDSRHILELPTNTTYRSQWEERIKHDALFIKEGESGAIWGGLQVKGFQPNFDNYVKELITYFETRMNGATDPSARAVYEALKLLTELQQDETVRKLLLDSGFITIDNGIWTVSEFAITDLETQPCEVIKTLLSDTCLNKLKDVIETLDSITPDWTGVAEVDLSVLPLGPVAIDATDALLIKTGIQALIAKARLLSSYNLDWDFSQSIEIPHLPLTKIDNTHPDSWKGLPSLSVTDMQYGLTFQLQVAEVDTGTLVFRITPDVPGVLAGNIVYWSTTIEATNAYYNAGSFERMAEFTDGSILLSYSGCASIYEAACAELDAREVPFMISFSDGWDASPFAPANFYNLKGPKYLPPLTILDSQEAFLNGRVAGVDLNQAKADMKAAANAFKSALTALRKRSGSDENLFNLDASISEADLDLVADYTDTFITALDEQVRVTHDAVDHLFNFAPLFTYDGPEWKHLPQIVDGEFVFGTEPDPTYCGIYVVEDFCRLYLAAFPGGQVTGATTGTYPSGTEFTVTAVPDKGNNFSGWIGTFNSMANPLTFTLTSDMFFNACFTTFDTSLEEHSELREWLASVVLAGKSGAVSVDADSIADVDAARLLGIVPEWSENTDGTIAVDAKTNFEVSALRVEDKKVYLTIKVTVEKGRPLPDTIRLGGTLTINVKDKLSEPWDATPIEFNPDEITPTRVTDADETAPDAYEINLEIDVSDHKFYQVIVK